MNINLIKTEQDYQAALERLEILFDAEPDTPEGDEAEILTILIDEYENEFHAIDAPDPIEAIKFRMEQLGMKKKDLAKIIGYKSRVSELFSGRRKLSLTMIRNLHSRLNIPYDALMTEY